MGKSSHGMGSLKIAEIMNNWMLKSKITLNTWSLNMSAIVSSSNVHSAVARCLTFCLTIITFVIFVVQVYGV